MLASVVVPRPHAAQRPPARQLQAGNGQRALVTTAAAQAGGGKQNPTSAPSGAGGAMLEEILTLVKKIDTRQEEQGQMLAKLDARQQEQGRVQRKQGRMQRKQGKRLANMDTRQQQQGATQRKQGKTLAQLDTRQQQQGAVQRKQAQTLAKLGTRQQQQGKQQAVIAQHVGYLSENAARMQRMLRGDDLQLRSGMVVSSAGELVPICSMPQYPADKDSLLRGVASLHSAVERAFVAVALLMQAEAEALGVVLPPHPGHTLAGMARWLRQARALLLRARHEGKAKGKPAWLDACDDLAAYAEAAAESSQLAFRALEKQGGLALLLLGAAATDELVQCLEMDGEPVLRFTKAGLELDLLEIKPSADAIRDAVPQLQRQVNILLLALALSNAAALEQQGPPHVVATVEVTAQAPKPQAVKDWESRQLLVGGVGPAPKVPMRLRIRH